MKRKVRKLAVLASGSGTTLQAVLDAIDNGELEAVVSIVISDNPKAFALERAKQARIETHILKAKTAEERDEELYQVLIHKEVYDEDYDDILVLLLGYLKLVGPKTVNNFDIINTHPSLIPQYCGKGMHGMHVHEAVVANGESESGVTLHFVNEEYDDGQIIYQTRVPVYPEDNANDVSSRVQRAEKAQLVSALIDFTRGKIDIP